LVPAAEKGKIEAGRAQAAAGQLVPHEVVRAKAQKILDEKKAPQ